MYARRIKGIDCKSLDEARMSLDHETIIGYPLSLYVTCGTKTYDLQMRIRNDVSYMVVVPKWSEENIAETERARITINAYAKLIVEAALRQDHVLACYHDVDGETEISFIYGEKVNEQDRQEQIDRVTYLLSPQRIRFTVGPLYCCLEASETNYNR